MRKTQRNWQRWNLASGYPLEVYSLPYVSSSLYYNNLPLTPHSIEGKRSIRTDSFEYPTCCSLIFLPVRKDFIPHSIPLLNRLPPLTLNLNPRHSTHPRLLPTVNLQLLYPLPFQQLTNNRMDQLRWYPLEVATMGNGSL